MIAARVAKLGVLQPRLLEFAQIVHIKLALPQAAQPGIHFFGKTVTLHLLVETHYLQDREDEKKAQHSARFEPTTSRILQFKHVLYH